MFKCVDFLFLILFYVSLLTGDAVLIVSEQTVSIPKSFWFVLVYFRFI